MIVKQSFKKDFVIVSRMLLRDKAISYQAKALATFISSLPSDWILYTEWIKEELGMCKRTVQRCLKELADSGYIKKFQIIDKKTNKFTNGWGVIFLNPHDVIEESVEEIKTDLSENEEKSEEIKVYKRELEKAEKIEAQEVEGMILSGLEPPQDEQSPTNPPPEQVKKIGLSVLSRTYIRKDFLCNKKDFLIKENDKNFLIFEKKTKREINISLEGFNDIERQKIEDWFTYKAKQKRKRLNLMSKERLLNKLRTFKLAKQDIVAIIDRSIENGWQGLFEFKRPKLKAYEKQKDEKFKKAMDIWESLKAEDKNAKAL